MINKIFYVVLVLYIAYTVSMLARVIYGASHSTDGVVYGQLQDQLRELDTQNQLLKTQIAEAESFRVIEEKAKAMGFIPVDDAHTIYLK